MQNNPSDKSILIPLIASICEKRNIYQKDVIIPGSKKEAGEASMTISFDFNKPEKQ
jgi:hypothetical protein